MKIDIKANRVALAEEADTNAATVQRIQDYLARTGLAIPDFAHRIGYSDVSLRLFLHDRYHNVARTGRVLARAANEFIDLHPVAAPTRLQGDLYDTANVRAIRDTFQKLLPRPVAYMIYAPPGSQKSFVLENQVAQLNADEMSKPDGCRAFYVYARANVRPRDMMRRISIASGCRVANDIDPMLSNIRFEFRGRRVLLVIDEAQHLSLDCFETLRELLDQSPYFSLLFAGSHDLKRKFDEFSATLEQWNSRIIAKVRLPGLERPEARGIIEREIGDLLNRKPAAEASRLIDGLIAGATTRDAFESNRSYINIRTLTNALDQIKAAAAERETAEPVEETV